MLLFLSVARGGHLHDGAYGIINVQGEEVVAPKYAFGAVDTMLNVLLDSTCRKREYPQYDSVMPSDHYDRTMVMRSGKWGVVDHLGNEVLEPLYDSISIGKIRSNFSISVCVDGKWGVADYHGNIGAPAIYDQRPIVSTWGCLMLRQVDRDFALSNNREIVEIKREGMDIFPLKQYWSNKDE